MDKRSKHALIRILILLAIIGGFIVYSFYIEPNSLVIEKREFSFDDLPQNFHRLKIVFLSDLHYDDETSIKRIKRTVDMTNSLEPDLILFGGDFVSDSDKVPADSKKKIAPCMDILKNLKAKYGVFAVLGNHDQSVGADDLEASLKSIGVTVLRNSHKWINIKKEHIYILGINDLYWGGGSIKKSLVGMKHQDSFKILLSHNPDAAYEAETLGIDLILSGHTHGGQMRLPFYKSFIKGRFIYSDLIAGRYDIGVSVLYVSRGIGTTWLPARFRSKPEITEIVLTKQKETDK